MMLRSVKAMRGGPVLAQDGKIGSIVDVYFDDAGWDVRYLVLDTGKPMPRRQVLIPPAALASSGEPSIRVRLTREQIEKSPELDEDRPMYLQWDMASVVHRGNPHLRSSEIIIGYAVQVLDGAAGHVADIVVDADGWTIASLVVDTGQFLPGKRVRVSPQAVRRIEWPERRLHLGLTRDALRKLPAAGNAVANP